MDAVTELSSYREYAALSEQLRGLGFNEDQSEGAPICRWRAGALTLDVMPDNESILGFTFYVDLGRELPRSAAAFSEAGENKRGGRA